MDNLLRFWQHLPYKLSPVLLDIGPITLHYYGVMYLVAFLIAYGMARYRLGREPFRFTRRQAGDLMTYMIVGLIIGARLGYVLFYNLSYYSAHPLEIVLPFAFDDGIRFTGISGMSYHGGLIGVILAVVLYCRRAGRQFREAADLFIPGIPLGYTFGRLGNFINGELYGRQTRAAIGMHFPDAPGDALRHPTQLYEAFFEGIFIFAVLWLIRKKSYPRGAMMGFYLILYGTVRFFIEFYREPDAHIGFAIGILTTGQVLCAAMVIAGTALLVILYHHHRRAAAPLHAKGLQRPVDKSGQKG